MCFFYCQTCYVRRSCYQYVMMHRSICQLSDDALTVAVARLARCERAAMVELVVHLAVFDERRLYLGAAYSSLFTCCRGVLGLSEHETYHRILAARLGRAFPLVFEMLGAGTVNPTTLRLVARHLTDENHQGNTGQHLASLSRAQRLRGGQVFGPRQYGRAGNVKTSGSGVAANSTRTGPSWPADATEEARTPPPGWYQSAGGGV
jgi:hypothetical protein